MKKLINKILNKLNLIQGAILSVLAGLGIAGIGYLAVIFIMAKNL